MPRPAKGARLWLRPARRDASGRITHAATWIILDGGRQRVTGFGADAREEAERALAEHIAAKYEAPRRGRDLTEIPLTDVIHIYLKDVVPGQARPKPAAERCTRLLMWWNGKTLADVTAATCAAYVAGRGNTGGARRDLEDLRAAIGHHAKEGLHRGEVRVSLPAKGAPRERWLTRDEAAALLWACWRAREQQRRGRKGEPGEPQPTKRWTMRHLARFILIGLYTGTRAGAIASASWSASAGRSYVDLEQGVFYRLAVGARPTKKRQPPVPIPARLLAHMRRWHDAAAAELRAAGIDQPVPAGYLVEYHGQPVQSVKTAFRSAVDLAGLAGQITPHTLRHTAATWLMQAGVPMWEAAGFLGMSTQMVERTYGHHHPEHLKGAATALGSRPGTANKTPKESVNRKRTRGGEVKR